MKNLTRYFRLLPAVILVGAALLVMKSVNIVQDARAQTALTGQAPAPEPKDTTQVAVADPAIDDSEANSAAEVDVLTSLSKRRQELDAREQALNMQANLIAAAEQRVDGKIDALKNLQTQMQTLLGQRDAADQAQLTSLVKTYSSMKPADAARIFNTLDDTVQLNVAAAMKSDVLGAILAKMQPEVAEKLTVRLANRLKLPETAPAALAAANATQAACISPAPGATATSPVDTSLASITPASVPPAANPPAQSAAPTPVPSTPPTAAPKQPPATAAAPPPKQPVTNPPAPAASATKSPASAPPASPKQQAVNTPAKPSVPAPTPAAKAKGG